MFVVQLLQLLYVDISYVDITQRSTYVIISPGQQEQKTYLLSSPFIMCQSQIFFLHTFEMEPQQTVSDICLNHQILISRPMIRSDQESLLHYSCFACCFFVRLLLVSFCLKNSFPLPILLGPFLALLADSQGQGGLFCLQDSEQTDVIAFSYGAEYQFFLSSRTYDEKTSKSLLVLFCIIFLCNWRLSFVFNFLKLYILASVPYPMDSISFFNLGI